MKALSVATLVCPSAWLPWMSRNSKRSTTGTSSGRPFSLSSSMVSPTPVREKEDSDPGRLHDAGRRSCPIAPNQESASINRPSKTPTVPSSLPAKQRPLHIFAFLSGYSRPTAGLVSGCANAGRLAAPGCISIHEEGGLTGEAYEERGPPSRRN